MIKMTERKVVEILKCNYCRCYYWKGKGAFLSYGNCCGREKCREKSNILFQGMLEDVAKVVAIVSILQALKDQDIIK